MVVTITHISAAPGNHCFTNDEPLREPRNKPDIQTQALNGTRST